MFSAVVGCVLGLDYRWACFSAAVASLILCLSQAGKLIPGWILTRLQQTHRSHSCHVFFRG